MHLKKIEGERIAITDSIVSDKTVEDFITPYRTHLNEDLDNILTIAADTYAKSDGEFNTAIGNLMADAILQECDPVFFNRTSKHIDAVLLNYGGIRSIISKGNVTTRTAFEVMPFENAVVVVALNGKQIHKMFDYLSKRKKAHPVSNTVKIVLNADYSLESASINNLPVDEKKTYYLATNDYLYNGGDGMNFFKPNDSVYVLDYKIRNVLIDHFKKTDTIQPVIDNRFIRLKD